MISSHLLTINTGSSSLKAALYAFENGERPVLTAHMERIGPSESRFRISDERGATLLDREGAIADHAAAFTTLWEWLAQAGHVSALRGIGHRLVHGGDRFSAPVRITPDVTVALRALVPLAPEHLPQAISAIEAVTRAAPALPQVACFDTAFHHALPPLARRYALPRALADSGLVRYGFHGLSYEYILHTLRALHGPAADGRLVVAHLGNGASMAAIRNGRSIDTTMGFTPLAGLVMGTRAGDVDPGLLLYLLQQRDVAPADLNRMLNKESGLLGVSGSSGDMQRLLEREAGDPRAAEAVALFCYQAKKYLGAYAATLGGLDTLVFTGGIGEHAAPVRARICDGLAFLGIELDEGRNATGAPIISRDDARVTVRVIPTDEDLMIARHTRQVISD